jgi:ankyrin repeat protein
MAEAGAAVGAVSGEGRTALIHAAEHVSNPAPAPRRRAPAARLTARRGAAQGHTETCMALVELGAHPTAVLLFGESAAELARSRGHPETARALEYAHAERANVNRISELEG